MPDCSFCGRESVYFQRTAGVHRCDRCLEDYVKKKFRRTVSQEKLVEPGDLVVVAVSGGTDSMTALKLLHEHSQHKEFEVKAITIDEGIEAYRDESLPLARSFTQNLGVEHLVISFDDVFGATLDELSNISRGRGGPDICTICGIFRRSLLNQSAREMGADKIAIGHNLDDVVQTVMLNYLRGDLSRLQRLRPKSRGKEGFVPRIKPLRVLSEKEIAIYAMLKDFAVHIDECPHVGGMRSEVRNFINKMEENHPTTKFRILRTFEKIRPHLPNGSAKIQLGKCEICGEPTSNTLCRSCSILDELGLEREKKTLIS
ncbi:MAG: TIGR00269 family protein [Candidatus Hadarchaeota archaeon]